MDKCIPLINKLQEVQTKAQLRNSPIQLPQIVVVGSQSSGKSSVLESFVGYPFLPRGKGIVTRRPLILQMVQTFPRTERPEKAKASGFWAKFNHKNEYMTAYEDILQEIQHETDKVAGKNKGISNEPILLTLYSDQVVNLTVVDLPGITKVPVGDQPEDIEHQICELIMEYIKNEDSIILAVYAANTDMATSEAVKMAKEVDPSGERTLAVITKLDLMDKGTDATDCLEGRVIPVKLGIIGVINRSQQDINNNKTIEKALRDEMKFLEQNYPTVAHKNGTTYLATTLSRLLVKHIEKCIPHLKAKIGAMIKSNGEELRKYGHEVINKEQTMFIILKEFSDAYCQSLDGSCKVLDTTKLKGGARIFHITQDIFSANIDQIEPLENLNSKETLIAMRNATGVEPSLHVPQNVFASLVSKQLGLLDEPSLECVKLVHMEMTNMIKNCEKDLEDKMSRFPKLRKKIRDVALKFLVDRLKSAERMIEDLIAMEKSFVNVRNQDFVKEWREAEKRAEEQLNETDEYEVKQLSKAEKHALEQMRRIDKSAIEQRRKTDKYAIERRSNRSVFGAAYATPQVILTPQVNLTEEKVEELFDASLTNISCGSSEDVSDIESLIEIYFRVVCKDMKDKVPKAVMYTLVNHVKDHLLENLLANLCRKDDPNLLTENSKIQEERIRLTKVIQTLKDSEKILDDFEDELNFNE